MILRKSTIAVFCSATILKRTNNRMKKENTKRILKKASLEIQIMILLVNIIIDIQGHM